jgi:phage shock protein E
MRIVYTINCLLFLFCFSFTSRSQSVQPAASGIRLVSPAAFKTTYENIKTKKLLLDVRTPSEYKKGHLKNAILIDIFRDDFADAVKQLDPNQPVFVYCGVGGRSAEAAEILQKAGFKTVYDLDGGIKAWQQQNFPVTISDAE